MANMIHENHLNLISLGWYVWKCLMMNSVNLDSAPEKKRAIGIKEKEKGLSGDDDQLKVSVSLHNETGNVF